MRAITILMILFSCGCGKEEAPVINMGQDQGQSVRKIYVGEPCGHVPPLNCTACTVQWSNGDRGLVCRR